VEDVEDVEDLEDLPDVLYVDELDRMGRVGPLLFTDRFITCLLFTAWYWELRLFGFIC